MSLSVIPTPGGTSSTAPLGGVRRARAALSRLFEPNDLVGSALLAAVGPERALIVASGRQWPSRCEELEVFATLKNAGVRAWKGLEESIQRWKPRVETMNPERDFATIRRFGGGVLIPEDAQWPEALADLGLSMPLLLWYRNAGRPGPAAVQLPLLDRCVAVVGARAATSYGVQAASDLSYALVARGCTVVSGGAFGIDAAAHRAALAVPRAPSADNRMDESAARDDGSATSDDADAYGPVVPPTIAVLAGGLDRLYPAGNDELLRQIERTGLLLAEVPPGTNPTRHRFLQRNRLIAALAGTSVVVEAGWRSGALNTAHHAVELGRNVAAVPGSIFSAASAGCHRLLREGAACVTDAAEITELTGFAESGASSPVQPVLPAVHDGLRPADLLLLDALPKRKGSVAAKLAQVAGLSVPEVQAGLGRLELLGLAQRADGGYRKSPD